MHVLSSVIEWHMCVDVYILVNYLYENVRAYIKYTVEFGNFSRIMWVKAIMVEKNGEKSVVMPWNFMCQNFISCLVISFANTLLDKYTDMLI